MIGVYSRDDPEKKLEFSSREDNTYSGGNNISV